MRIINTYEAKTQFSQLLEKVNHGEEIIIGKAGKPVAKLVPYHVADDKPRKPGYWKGQVKIAEDFDVLSKEILDLFHGDAE